MCLKLAGCQDRFLQQDFKCMRCGPQKAVYINKKWWDANRDIRLRWDAENGGEYGGAPE